MSTMTRNSVTRSGSEMVGWFGFNGTFNNVQKCTINSISLPYNK